jgi:DNA-cytosine methyltransferase
MNVLSLFDGMSCGQQALDRLGIKVDNYFASEIDKYAIQVTMANYPNTIQLGSVVNVDGYSLPKIDLLLGGSPCQSFSFAGKRKGMSTKCETEILTLEHYLELKAEGYEFEGQSYLFWEYMRLLNECKPTYFLLENVEMGEKWEKVLTKAIGVNALHINSALVSAQNRKRIYWTNIGMQPSGLFGDLESIIEQPKDRGILLKDILESTIHANYFKMGERDQQYIIHNMMPRSSTSGKGGTGHLSRNDGKTYCLDTGNTNAVEVREVKQISTNNKSNGGTQPYQQDRIYDIDGISPALNTDGRGHAVEVKALNERQKANYKNEDEKANTFLSTSWKGSQANGITLVGNSRIRRLTPKECERLQTVADNYTNHVSDSQRYKMLGNGWTIEVIIHILKYINL